MPQQRAAPSAASTAPGLPCQAHTPPRELSQRAPQLKPESRTRGMALGHGAPGLFPGVTVPPPVSNHDTDLGLRPTQAATGPATAPHPPTTERLKVSRQDRCRVPGSVTHCGSARLTLSHDPLGRAGSGWPGRRVAGEGTLTGQGTRWALLTALPSSQRTSVPCYSQSIAPINSAALTGPPTPASQTPPPALPLTPFPLRPPMAWITQGGSQSYRPCPLVRPQLRRLLSQGLVPGASEQGPGNRLVPRALLCSR